MLMLVILMHTGRPPVSVARAVLEKAESDTHHNQQWWAGHSRGQRNLLPAPFQIITTMRGNHVRQNTSISKSLSGRRLNISAKTIHQENGRLVLSVKAHS